MRFGPVVSDFFLPFPIIADLDGEVRVGVVVVCIAPFMFLEELDHDLFIKPGLYG